jgi:hypothetical protein
MEHITTENIEKKMEELLDTAPLTCANLEKFVLMARAMKYLGKVHREFTIDDAREWVSSMNPPARWTMEQTSLVMHQKGLHYKAWEFWAVMNMLVSDYGKTVAKYGMDNPDFWADMACDFLHDQDAEEGKVGKYWRDIVGH